MHLTGIIHAFFAYGQTGSGKSYSIFGYGANIGIIPMAWAEIFRRVSDIINKDAQEVQNRPIQKPDPKKKKIVEEDEDGNQEEIYEGNIKFEVTVSMLEIYNEWVQDLFIKPNNRPKGGLKIRETKSDGVYVEELTTIPVTSYEDIAEQIEREEHLSERLVQLIWMQLLLVLIQ